MKDYVKLIKHDTTISVCFYIEMDKPFAIGEKMYEIDENAYRMAITGKHFLIII